MEQKVSHTEQDLDAVLRDLLDLQEDVLAAPAHSQGRLAKLHANYRWSARNLLQYLALRRRDLRPLQHRLACLGLSSLGRCESHVLATVETVLHVVHRLAGRTTPADPQESSLDFASGRRLLADHTDALLGPATSGRGVRIMVTMPSEAADDPLLIHKLLQQGMNCMRINCAHDDPAVWSRMIEHLRRAERALNRSCRLVMDLAGPKLRTGPLDSQLAVARIRPQRDAYGRVTSPARVWLTADAQPPVPADACLSVPREWLARLKRGTDIRLCDARGATRSLEVVEVIQGGCWAEACKTIYVVPGTVLTSGQRTTKRKYREAAVSAIPSGEPAIVLRRGDVLHVTRDQRPGRPAAVDADGTVLTSATIGCTLPEVCDDVRPGETIWFDDGKIGGVVEVVEQQRMVVRITHAREQGDKLRGDKGINLPESRLRLPALTSKDLEDLAFVAEHADVVELSFANTIEDVESLQDHLARAGDRQPAIVLKIETRRGFENLPDMLLTAMRAPSCGVMIARGDLAVECGFERLAEVQEEILWLCEAAHVPVIWATQVLESLAKDGMPSRAEITDAAMGDRAECVMLNKGPHMLSAVRLLDDILRRMQEHQTKKRAMLRELRLAHTLSPDLGPGPIA